MDKFKNTDIKLSDRNYNLDLLRIISMLGIIGLHMLNAGGMLSAAENLNHIMARVIAIIMYSSVNIFAMLTGYLYVSKEKISSVSIVKLLMVVFFYCVVITTLALVCYSGMFVNNKKLILVSLFPPIKGRYWYITSYILLFFMIPYINILLKAISKETFRKMLGILFVLLSVITTIGIKDYFKIDNGYSPFWLVFCYLAGGYIKLYGGFFNFSRLKKCVIILINIFLVLLIEVVFGKILGFAVSFHEYTSPFTFINAILVMEIFCEIRSNKILPQIILPLSASSFGVYIIHSHILIYDNLISGKLEWFGGANPVLWLFYFAVINIGIYLFCHIIEFVRKLIFKLLHFDGLAKKIGDNLDKKLGWNSKD